MRRWRRTLCVLSALRTWRILGKNTCVMFQLELGGGPAVGLSVCGESTAAQEGQNTQRTDDDSSREATFVRWLRSKGISALILSSMSDLQAALTHPGSSPPHVVSAARSTLTRLLGHLLGQSDRASGRCIAGKADEDRLKVTSPQSRMKTLVSSLQQHFLLFSQRLHSAEVERRSLRVELANLRKAARRQESEKSCKTVPVERFHSVCSELRQALSREQEAQKLIQDQNNQLNTLRVRVDSHTTEQTDTQRTLTHNQQLLAEAHQQVSGKERSLRILGKHLSGVQREKRQLEERLQRADEELREDATYDSFTSSL
uniref:Coiled-coil domain containing 171 n=1 Tax=Sphaeramia orbicularis TaxID=375764 RepID=A0A672ZCN8_9TELE